MVKNTMVLYLMPFGPPPSALVMARQVWVWC